MTKKTFHAAMMMSALASAAFAQGNSNDNMPFVMNGVTFANKQAFIDNARCSTRKLEQDEVEEMDRLVRGFQGRAPGAAARTAE